VGRVYCYLSLVLTDSIMALAPQHRDDKPFKQRHSQYPSFQRPIKINS